MPSISFPILILVSALMFFLSILLKSSIVRPLDWPSIYTIELVSLLVIIYSIPSVSVDSAVGLSGLLVLLLVSLTSVELSNSTLLKSKLKVPSLYRGLRLERLSVPFFPFPSKE